MGRLLVADLETWYLGGGRDILGASSVFGFLGDFCFSVEVVFAASWGAAVGAGATSSAFVGVACDAGLVGLLLARGCLEGRVGFSSGGCALSPSVRDSAAARSAARWASWGDDGCSEEAFGGREGWRMGLAFGGGSIYYQSLLKVSIDAYDLRSACHGLAVEKQKCWRDATTRGAANGLSRGTRDCSRGIAVYRKLIIAQRRTSQWPKICSRAMTLQASVVNCGSTPEV